MLNYALRIHCLLIPIENESLLLPSANIAEVIHFIEPEEIRGAPDWLLGFIKWRDLKIPLVAFEAIIGRGRPEVEGVKRILVINTLAGNPTLPFFGLLVQGRPRPLQVDESLVTPMSKNPEPGVLRYVHVYGDPAIIPDPDHIEKLLHEFKDKVATKKR